MHDVIIIIICTHKTYVYTSSSWLHTHQLVIIHRKIYQMQVLDVCGDLQRAAVHSFEILRSGLQQKYQTDREPKIDSDDYSYTHSYTHFVQFYIPPKNSSHKIMITIIIIMVMVMIKRRITGCSSIRIHRSTVVVVGSSSINISSISIVAIIIISRSVVALTWFM